MSSQLALDPHVMTCRDDGHDWKVIDFNFERRILTERCARCRITRHREPEITTGRAPRKVKK